VSPYTITCTKEQPTFQAPRGNAVVSCYKDSYAYLKQRMKLNSVHSEPEKRKKKKLGRHSGRSLTSDYAENLNDVRKIVGPSNLEQFSSNFDSFCTPINIRQVSPEKRSETQVGISVKCALLLTTCTKIGICRYALTRRHQISLKFI